RAAGHVPLRRDGAGSSLTPQPESALQRGDGQRALTSPRVDATNKRYMAHFAYRHSDLCCEQVSLRSLAADVGTPAYVYSKAALLESYRGYDDAFAEVPHVVCYSVKANGNLGVLGTLARAGAGADAVARIAALVKTLRERSIEIRMVDVGGGLGIRYRDEAPPTHREYARVLLPALRELGVTVLLEPGRSIVGNAGILLTRVLYRKETGEKTFVV